MQCFQEIFLAHICLITFVSVKKLLNTEFITYLLYFPFIHTKSLQYLMCYVRVWIQKLYYFYFYTANFRGYLICSAMEQELRWDTKDFLAESSYQVHYITVLYYTVLYYTVLYCTVLYCTVLYCTVYSTWRPSLWLWL